MTQGLTTFHSEGNAGIRHLQLTFTATGVLWSVIFLRVWEEEDGLCVCVRACMRACVCVHVCVVGGVSFQQTEHTNEFNYLFWLLGCIHTHTQILKHGTRKTYCVDNTKHQEHDCMIWATSDSRDCVDEGFEPSVTAETVLMKDLNQQWQQGLSWWRIWAISDSKDCVDEGFEPSVTAETVLMKDLSHQWQQGLCWWRIWAISDSRDCVDEGFEPSVTAGTVLMKDFEPSVTAGTVLMKDFNHQWQQRLCWWRIWDISDSRDCVDEGFETSVTAGTVLMKDLNYQWQQGLCWWRT